MKKIFWLIAACLLLTMTVFAQAELEISSEVSVVMDGYAVKAAAVLDGEKVSATWTSSDAAHLTVSADGTLTARNSTGSEIEVSVTAVYGENTAVKTYAVVPQATSFIVCRNGNSCANQVLEVAAGESLQLDTTCKPQCAAAAAVWKTSDAGVASVDQNGLVTAVGRGQAEITATLPSGRYTRCTVQVYVAPVSITLPESLELGLSLSCDSGVTIEPQEAADCKLTWKSSNSSVCEVSSNGKLTARGSGSAVITCTASNGLSASVNVEVYRRVTQITAAREGISLAVNAAYQLGFTVSPSNAKYADLTYSSSDTSVATVDDNGLVTGISEGECRIYAESREGVKASTYVKVRYIKLTGASFDKSFLTMNAGDQKTAALTYEPENASDKTVTFTSSEPGVVSVEDGVLTAVSEGRSCITVFVNGKETDSMTVRVVSDGSLPLAGVRIGINPGHQIALNLSQKPIAPGSDKTGNANSGYAVGVVTYTKEYEVTLNVGLYLRDMLEAQGAEVVMTRTENDVHLDNVQRAEMLNEAGVDFAIQLHCNNNPDSSKSTGMSMYVKSKDYVSHDIAEVVLAAACEATGAANRNVRWYDRYMSLNYSTTPAALIEMGYLSTPEEDLLLSTDGYQYIIAQGICNGIVEYYCGTN